MDTQPIGPLASLPARSGWAGLLILFAWSALVQAQDTRVEATAEIESARPFLRWERPSYRNFAFRNYTNYLNHSFPYEDAPRAYYGPLGDHLINGYDLYKWEETRAPGQEYGSAVFKPNEMYQLVWDKVYDAVVVGRDGYGSWGYSLVVADNMIARLSPLTLSMTSFNGFRLDISTPRLQLTGMGSRIERPHTYQEEGLFWAIERTHYADESTMLLGSRAQVDLGRLKMGLNWANAHVYQSTQPGNGLKGRLKPVQPLMDWIVVRFSDDSPLDRTGGAVVQEVQLVVNGQARPDLVPRVVRHHGGIGPQVGTLSQRTGRVAVVEYTQFAGHRLFYRGRDDMPLYADYLYRLDLEEGVDVSANAVPEVLGSIFKVESPEEALRADGAEQLVFLFDVSQEPLVESVQVEALLGNDYRVDVALLSNVNPRAKVYYGEYLSTFYRPVLRSPGNVRDLANFKRRRFGIGEDTGVFTYSADLNLSLPGLEVQGEYARSALYLRYPGEREGQPVFDRSPRFVERGAAYYLNATRWFGRGRLGAEIFAINPGFTTSLRTFLNRGTHRRNNTNLIGMYNQTVYWDLVEDNDDGDRFPDRRVGNLVGFSNDSQAHDVDGVFLDQDEDNDGWPETNRDGDLIPDSEEPFLMYYVEPNAYAYGLDRNHNDEPDPREDDGEVDYPYDYDQRGYHLFGQLDMSPHWSLALGRYATAQIAGGGRNRSAYALLTYQRQGIERLRQVFFENSLRRVQDDIADEYVSWDENADRTRNFSFRGLSRGNVIDAFIHDYPPIFSYSFVPDLVFYQDSYVNESYFEARLRPWSTLNVVQKLRLRFNWQQGGRLYNGLFQKERRLDFHTSVSRLEYTWNWGRLKVTPQYKLMLLRLMDRGQNRRMRDDFRSIPIVRLEYPLLLRTTLRAGVQGWGPIPYLRRDRVASRFSFEQRTSFVTLTNQSKYFGYELVTMVGLRKNQRGYETKFLDARNFDGLTFFVRALVGFTLYGRPL